MTGFASQRFAVLATVPEFGEPDGGVEEMAITGEMMDNRIGFDTIEGGFHLPIGVSFLDKPQLSSVAISTISLDGVAERDPLHICEPETGYETMVFLGGSTLFSAYTRKYWTIDEAQAGHAETLNQLLDRTLPLAIPINYWISLKHLDEREELAAV